MRVHGELTLVGKTATNSFTFDGNIGGDKLGPGIYELTATPTGGKSVQATFKLLP